VIGIDLFGVLYGIKAFAGDMIAHGEPCHIVFLASPVLVIAACVSVHRALRQVSPGTERLVTGAV
jgi:hypothetical protein